MAMARVGRVLRGLVLGTLRGLWAASVVLVPTIGVWVASSIAAYRNGPVWLACACGLLLFPGLPLLWEAVGTWRRGPRARPRILTFWDRLILRTLVLNVAVLAGLLARLPETTFAALSTRGDWFLDGREGPRVDPVRAAVFVAADRLQWLYEAVHEDTYEEVLVEPPPPPPPPPPLPVPKDSTKPGPVGPEVAPEVAPEGATWPLPDTLHPLVVNMPAQAQVSIASVGRYIAEHEPDRRLRVKALHDFVAGWVAYDGAAYEDRHRADFVFPPQDAETVFNRRIGVCAGYAQLLSALGEAAGEEIVVVSGDARTAGSDVTGESHAWNAARIDDVWQLIDVTWDAGSTRGRVFTRAYSATYLFTPPEVFAVSHFPREENWQLLAKPRSRGEFFRGPMMRAEFFAEGLGLLSPDRSQVTVDLMFEARVSNPRGRFMMANFVTPGGVEVDCAVTQGPVVATRCALPTAGSYEVRLYAAAQQYGSYPEVGSFAVLRAR